MKNIFEKVKSMNWLLWSLMGISIIVIISVVAVVGVELETQFTNKGETEKQKKIEQIIQSEDFQLKINEEAEREYYQDVLEEAIQRLEELDEGGFTPNAMKSAALQTYLENRDALALIPYVDEIVQMPRYIEVVAIVGHETGFCTEGVGSSQNNCGAIISSKGGFKTYANKLDAIEDVAILLQKPLYKDKTIAEMNGTYCVHEGGECPGWTENIEHAIEQMKLLAYTGQFTEN